MRRAAALLILLPSAVLAQPSTSPQQKETCVDVKVGSAQAYDCLNQQLAGIAQNTHRFSSDSDAPYGATFTPANKTGQYNQDATRERLGTNFGHSVTPERPNRVYAAPFAGSARPH